MLEGAAVGLSLHEQRQLARIEHQLSQEKRLRSLATRLSEGRPGIRYRLSRLLRRRRFRRRR